MDVVKIVLVRLFWFLAGAVVLDCVHEHEDKERIYKDKYPVHHTETYYRIMNPEWFD